MPRVNQCVTCAWESENGPLDPELSNVAAAKKLGITESGIRNHRKNHGERSSDESALESEQAALAGTADVGPDGGSFNNIQSDEPITDWTDIFKRFKLDPDSFEILDDTVHMSTWQTSKRTEDGDRDVVDLFSYRARFRRKGASERSLKELYAEAQRRVAPPVILPPTERTTVVVLADWQIGKTGRRGGTPELLQRLEQARRDVTLALAERAPKRVVLLDGGDGIEGFESGGNPMFTNDLSLPDQIDCYATELFKFVRLATAFGPVDVGAVSSNHAAWRRGKQTLGNPSDDWGLHVHKRVAKLADELEYDTTWHFPEEFDESLCIDIGGTPVGLVHGNQFGPGKAIDWWEGQAFGSQAAAGADVLITGHYHSFGAGVAGTNPATNRERMWLGAPTLDSGSDWYRNIKGRDSNPGTMIFDITPNGFDLGSLRIV